MAWLVFKTCQAQDVTISYDKNKFDFVGADPIGDNTVIEQTVNNTDAGTVRFIIVTTGAQNAISGSADVLTLNFTSKRQVQVLYQ